MSLTILKYPDPRLRIPATEITEITEEHRALAKEMAEIMYEAEGIGLAAPQVGQSLRLITVDVSGPEKREALLCLVNPRLTPDPEAGTVETEEGCLSVEDYRSKVKRHAKVKLNALDLDGNPVETDAEGLLAVCLQHEVDHLDGKVFLDRISRLKRALYDGKVRKRLRRSEEQHS